jgi:hypothetical protein
MKAVKLEQLLEIWSKILKDRDAQQALARLEKNGFGISHLTPTDPAFRRPSWADYISAIPLVPNRPSRRRIHSRTSLQKHWSLVRAMHRLIEKLDDPFCEMSIAIGRDYSVRDLTSLSKQLTETKEFIKQFLTWDCYIRERNPRNALIAELRWQIRSRTRKPHDRELRALIDAAFRAAGVKEGPYLTSNALDRIEKREKESRVKAIRRFRSRVSRLPAKT